MKPQMHTDEDSAMDGFRDLLQRLGRRRASVS